GALFGPSDGYVDGHSYCTLLADLLRERGARVLTSTPVTAVRKGSGGRHELETPDATIECDVVVNAAGAWAGQIGRILGVPAEVLPPRHQALVAHLPRELDYLMPSVIDYIPASGEIGLYFRHESPTTLIAGLHTEDRLHDVVDPDAYTRGGEHEFMTEVARR